jgi:hypothetical protein
MDQDTGLPRYNEKNDYPGQRFGKAVIPQEATSSGTIMLRSPRFRRSLAIWLVFLVGAYAIYTRYIRPYNEEQALLTKSVQAGAVGGEGAYGVNARPAFTNIIHLKELDTQFVPVTGKGRHAGRLVIVGDVHGMKNELVKLLDKVGFNDKKDHLVLTGDLVSKGPDSAGVVELAMSLRASAVRGNHEDRVLLAYDDMHTKQLPLPGPAEDQKTQIDDLEEESFNHGDYKDKALAKTFSQKQIEWLKKLPVILKVGEIDGMGEVVVVHGGLVPGVELEKQDHFATMNMRTIDLHTHVPSEQNTGVPWTKVGSL